MRSPEAGLYLVYVLTDESGCYIVETAIVRGQAIELYRQDDYYGKGKVGFRRIWPLQPIYHDIAWYLICEDCENGHLSVERVNRFSDCCEIIDRTYVGTLYIA